MKEQTHLGDTIDAADNFKVRYDKSVKEILADVQVLARIVKHTVSEAENLSIDEIIGCIDAGSIRIGTVPITPGLTNAGKVESTGTEDSVLNEGYVTYDIRFLLVIKANMLEIIINVEAQKSTDFKKLGYHLESRIVYYLARLISSQKSIDFAKSEYDNIKKVYSIWICMDAEDDADSISRISLQPEALFGKPYDFPKLDKMCGMVIRIRKNYSVSESKNRLIAMLEDVLSNEDSECKKQKLEEKYDMKMTMELEGRLNSMCNLSDVVVERAIEQGMKQGIEQGIEKGMKQGIEQGIELTQRSTAVNLKNMGMEPEKIAEAVGASVKKVIEWLS